MKRKAMIRLSDFEGEEGKETLVSLKALLAQGWVVRWWKRKRNGEWKKQKEKLIFDDARSIVKFAERKKRKGYVVQVAPFPSPPFSAYSGPIY